jgi:hypothetical protein
LGFTALDWAVYGGARKLAHACHTVHERETPRCVVFGRAAKALRILAIAQSQTAEFRQ